jgi:glucose-6-phosphate 1-epimerase
MPCCHDRAELELCAPSAAIGQLSERSQIVSVCSCHIVALTRDRFVIQAQKKCKKFVKTALLKNSVSFASGRGIKNVPAFMSEPTTRNQTNGATLGKVTLLDGQNEMPMMEVSTAWSTAEIYLHGAHVTQFRKQGEPPLLFMSQCSRFEPGQPIRGGIPVILPWFGMREGLGQHGFARLKTWDLKEVALAPDGSVSVRFRLPDYPEAAAFPSFVAEYLVRVNDALTLELSIQNVSRGDELALEDCLHTYFEIGDITAVSVCGLKGFDCLDKVENFARRTEKEDVIRFASEVNRIYLDTKGPIEILDPSLKRKIRIETQGANSTVVWNPWIAAAQQMPDFGNEEYTRMVCVESGNVSLNRLKLAPGETTTLTTKLSSMPLS